MGSQLAIVVFRSTLGVNPIVNWRENLFDFDDELLIHRFFDPIAPLRYTLRAGRPSHTTGEVRIGDGILQGEFGDV